MRRGRGSFWRKKSSSSTSVVTIAKTETSRPREALDSYDYGLYYDSVNARGKYDDLVLLENVGNEEIVETLRKRYVSGDMYTSIGPVLIAVNPYTQLSKGGKGIYEPGVRDYFHRKGGGGGGFMAPHIYRIAAEAFKDLCTDSRDQCVIVTGESGAGKTEAAKQLMHFVTTVGTSSDGQRATMEGVQRHLLESNPILEAFGNAQTIRNDNSSRFGKYMELQFSFKSVLRGGKVTNYLLEKSRVIKQARGERCFHVMHYLLQGANDREREEYQLLPPGDYAYLMREERGIVGVDDGMEFTKLKRSMYQVDIDGEDQSKMFHLLAGVLAIGNVRFEDHGDGKRATVVQTPDDALARAAACLGVDATALEAALTSVTLVVGGSGTGNGVTMKRASSWIGAESSFRRGSTNHARYLNGGDSANSRNALAKETYRRLFGWIVDKVNLSIECKSAGLTIGILDIYGFEVFNHNDFEQFCINYVNEKLQQYFIDHTIRAEQQDYETEGVKWEHVDYFNNKTVCDMIEGRRGLLSLLDEVSSIKSNDGSVLVNNYNRAMASHEHYFSGEEAVYGTGYAWRKSLGSRGSLPRTQSLGKQSCRLSTGRVDKQFLNAKKMFGIKHFAGDVTYEADNFIEKNADRLHQDLVALLSQASNPLAAKLFQQTPDAKPAANKARRHPSLSAQFKKQVDELCKSLARCRPHYVRCIKPNSTKTPLEMDVTMTTHQVKYLGLQENVRVRRQGYASRMAFGHFVRRYGFLSESTWPNRVTRKFWPDGTPYDPANPDPPEHLIKYDEIEEEFQEMREVEQIPSQSQNNTDSSSDDGQTDKEGNTPPVQRTPPRQNASSPKIPARSNAAAEAEAEAGTGAGALKKTTPGKILQALSPARIRSKLASATSGGIRTPTRHGATATSSPAPKKMVMGMVTVKRVRRVAREVLLVERTVWQRRDQSDRQATCALLEEGRPKKWEARLTGGKPIVLRVPRHCADSGEIKMGKTKIFIKHPHTLFDLEDQRPPALFAVATIIQAKARGYICRGRYLRFQAVIGKVAAVARGFLARLRYRRLLEGVALAQAAVRGKLQRARYLRLKEASKGRPLRYYALRIQKTHRGYSVRRKIPARTLAYALFLGNKMLAVSRNYQAAEKFQAVWRMYAARKAFFRSKRQAVVVQSLWRRRLARRQFEQMRDEDYQATLSSLKSGMTLVKHTVGSTFMVKNQRPVEFTYRNDGLLAWQGSGIRREQGVNIYCDVVKMTKGLTSKRLKRTGDTLKGDGNTPLDRRSPQHSGKYLVLHQKSGKTLDLECTDYVQRDSIKRTFSKLRGEW